MVELRNVITDADDVDVVVLAVHVAYKIPGVLGECMPVSILLEIYFDWISIYSLFCKSIFPQTQYISFFFFLGLKNKKAVFNCKELCSVEMAKVITLHAHIGADAFFLGKERYLFGTGWRKVHVRHFHY